MTKKNSNYDIKEGIIDGIPIVAGYVTASMAFGLLAKNLDIPLIYVFLFSLTNFAGASQFMAMSFIAIGAGVGEIVLATFLINFRHVLMSASISQKLEKSAQKISPIIAFGITDEVFSVASTKGKKLSAKYMLALQWISLSAWVGGSVLGYVLDGFIPLALRNSMMMTLYALFVSIIVTEAKKSSKVLFMVIGSGVLNLLLNKLAWLASGWNMVIAIIVVSLIGTFTLFKDEDNNTNLEEVG